MKQFSKYLTKNDITIKLALKLLSNVGHDTILFIVNGKNQLQGSISDGDIRRALLVGVRLDDKICNVINKNTKYLREDNYSINQLIEFRNKNFTILPLLDKNNIIIDIINLRYKKSYLPVDVVIMAGGKGLRLKPLTDHLPKPLLKIKNKCIIDYSLDRLIDYGINNFFVSVNYLGDQIVKHFEERKDIEISTRFILENEPLGTAGSISRIKKFKNEDILLTNSDILTNINYEDFFLDFIKRGADMSVVSIPYDIDVPYAVINSENNLVKSFEEKPTYTYYSNGGIYLIKKHVLDIIPKNKFYDATDLMQAVLDKNLKLVNYPLKDYWIDIGKHEDFKQAQKDVNFLKNL